jgi:hypothetical protein
MAPVQHEDSRGLIDRALSSNDSPDNTRVLNELIQYLKATVDEGKEWNAVQIATSVLLSYRHLKSIHRILCEVYRTASLYFDDKPKTANARIREIQAERKELESAAMEVRQKHGIDDLRVAELRKTFDKVTETLNRILGPLPPPPLAAAAVAAVAVVVAAAVAVVVAAAVAVVAVVVAAPNMRDARAKRHAVAPGCRPKRQRVTSSSQNHGLGGYGALDEGDEETIHVAPVKQEVIELEDENEEKTEYISSPMTAEQKTTLARNMGNLKRSNVSAGFREPVDLQKYPTYPQYVHKPMDLRIMRDKLKENQYATVQGFVNDFELLVSNCHQFNGEGHPFTEQALRMKERFENNVVADFKRSSDK